MSKITNCDHDVKYLLSVPKKVEAEDEDPAVCAVCALETERAENARLLEGIKLLDIEFSKCNQARDAAVIDHFHAQTATRAALDEEHSRNISLIATLESIRTLSKPYDLHPVLSSIASISEIAIRKYQP